MDIHVTIHATIHINNPGDLQPAIDQLGKVMASEAAKTEELQTAVDTAKGQTP